MSNTSSKLYLWWLAIRPKTLPAAAGPVLVGTAAAYLADTFKLLPALAAFAGALLLQIAVNLANDYFDAQNEIDSDERLGPVRVTQSGLIPPGQVKMAMAVSLSMAAMVFFYLGFVGGWPIIIVGVCSVLAALAYSGGPYPLASNGLGELFVFIFFGLVAVCGTYWVQAQALTWQAVLCSVPPGLLITAIMVVNNLRDMDTDRKAGKNTLAVRIGRNRTIVLYRALVVVSFLWLVPLLVWVKAGLIMVLPGLTVVMAWRLCLEIGRVQGSELNRTLAATAKLSFFFSLLLAVAFIV